MLYSCNKVALSFVCCYGFLFLGVGVLDNNKSEIAILLKLHVQYILHFVVININFFYQAVERCDRIKIWILLVSIFNKEKSTMVQWLTIKVIQIMSIFLVKSLGCFIIIMNDTFPSKISITTVKTPLMAYKSEIVFNKCLYLRYIRIK